MNKYNVRNNFKDIFGIYLLENQSFSGAYDMPIISNFDNIEAIDYLALYSDLKEYNKTNNTCVCFYQYDHIFDGKYGLYNSIIYQDKIRLKKFKDRFKNVKFIISPDYSLYGDFPNALQIYNIYKSRVCSIWLKNNTTASVIPNIRWTFNFTYDYCFDGIEKNSNIAIGLLGQIKNKENKLLFINGFKKLIDMINPKSILVYGFITDKNFDEFFSLAKDKDIKIIIPHSKIDKYKKENSIYGCR